MNLRAVVLLLAAISLGGGVIAHLAFARPADSPATTQSTITGVSGQRGAGYKPAAATFAESIGTSAASTPLSFPAGGPSPVLRQVGPSEWDTTVLLTDTNPDCQPLLPENTPPVTSDAARLGPGDAAAGIRLARSYEPPVQVAPELSKNALDFFDLLAGMPIKADPAEAEKVVVAGQSAAGQTAEASAPGQSLGSSCETTLTFTGLSQVPETATLVLDQAGASSEIPLTVSRNVTVTDYLGIPAIAGALITALSLLLSLRLTRRYRKSYGSTKEWLGHPILGSGAWTLNDSWATNISTGLVVIATVLGATTATSSLFPGLALDRFSIVNVTAGFFVAAAPVLFGILYSLFTTRHPGLTADATIGLPRLRPATIDVPSGASITVAADTTIRDRSANWAVVRGGGTYQIPPGAKVQVLAGILEVARPYVQVAEVLSAELLLQLSRDAGPEPDDPALTARYESGLQALRLAVEQAIIQSGIRGAELPDDEIRRRITEAIEGYRVRAAAQDIILAAADAFAINLGPEVVENSTQGFIEAMQQVVLDIRDPAAVYDAMAYSGTADIGIQPGSILQIDKWAGTLTVQASDVLSQPLSPAQPERPVPVEPGVQRVRLVPATPPGPSPAPLDQPVFISAAGGAKVTVTGGADITIPEGAKISAPRRPDDVVSKSRRLVAPQGTNVIAANVWIMLTVNILTMFGIGAELGIASVLTDFSEATEPWRISIFIALAAVAFLVIFYAATAVRAMADPQPGSSLSSQTGTSFTL
jgi:hypothetical protein